MALGSLHLSLTVDSPAVAALELARSALAAHQRMVVEMQILVVKLEAEVAAEAEAEAQKEQGER